MIVMMSYCSTAALIRVASLVLVLVLVQYEYEYGTVVDSRATVPYRQQTVR